MEKLIKNNHLIKFSQKISNLQKNSIYITTIQVDDILIDVGTSKFGGLPDFPKGNEIPKWNNKSLAFIAQFNLREISKYDIDNLLPKTGFLYFFYDHQWEAFGYDQKDRDSFKVLYYNVSPEELHRIQKPNDLDLIYQSCILNFKNTLNVPPYESRYTENLAFNKEELKNYFKLEKEVNFYEAPIFASDPSAQERIIHKLLGYPNQIQDDMQYTCVLISNGRKYGYPIEEHDPQRKQFEKEYDQWQLLLQIDSDDNTKMEWGDVGRIYFWIKKEDLLNKKFEKCWILMQDN